MQITWGLQVQNMTKQEQKTLRHKISYRRTILLSTGLYPDVVNKILLKKVNDGEWPEEARKIISEKKKSKVFRSKNWSMSPESIARGLDPRR